MFSTRLIHHLPGPKSMGSFIRFERHQHQSKVLCVSFGARASGSPSTAHPESCQHPPPHPEQPWYPPAIASGDRHHQQPGCSSGKTPQRPRHLPPYHRPGSESGHGTSPRCGESCPGTAKPIRGALEMEAIRRGGNRGRDGTVSQGARKSSGETKYLEACQQTSLWSALT